MKRLFALLAVLVFFLLAGKSQAALSIITAVSTNTTTATTNLGTIYSTGESDHFIPQTFSVTHTNLITFTNAMLIYRVTYDGGVTWANVTTVTNMGFNTAGGTNWVTSGTNTSPETWLPFGNTGANITRSNQVILQTQTAASITVISAFQPQ